MADLPYGICPYDKNHRVLLMRMPGHIVKCSKNYCGPPLAICKYNATHRVLPEEMDNHLETCADQIKFNSYKISESAKNFRKEPPSCLAKDNEPVKEH
ncbi:gametocyte-specific factor 1 [Scaptodrosophila lebanonensis]|uniref:Gametocyte-specific factor 1 n=1 Tax=Drosophila lebanonensis TaxID=7225 RepID=A0A6J2UA26_DROLE|nr:gametocyte-specific factor 1 [Scaptodrosophila lebanonensis]